MRGLKKNEGGGRRVALTLRLRESDWLHLKELTLELSKRWGRTVSSHELVEAAVAKMIAEGADGFEAALKD